jgi:hypothetical protein
MEGNRKNIIQALSITILLGIYFTLTSLRIFWNFIHNLRWHLWLNFLHSNRISQPTCNYWLHIPTSMPSSTTKIPFYIKTSFRLRSCKLILTFCRCSMTVLIRLHLLMRLMLS